MALRIVVMHKYYGCDTGCCGHVVKFQNEKGETNKSGEFQFAHPDSSSEKDRKAFAKELIREEFGEAHVKDLDWENSEVIDD